MQQFQAVLLDADGVMNDGKLLSLEEDFGIPSQRLQRFFTEAFPDCLKGKADLKEVIAPYLPQWGWEDTVDELLEYWFKTGSNVHEPVWDIAKQLQAKNIPLYLATNQEKYRTDYMRQHMGYDELFTEIFSSAYIGFTKPSEQFYKHILGALSAIPPASLLYWDDATANVEAARALGINAHHFVSVEDFEKKMHDYSALFN